jgi:hypothetical protein
MDPVERKKLNSKFIHMVADALTKGMDTKAADKLIYDDLVNEMANSFTADSKEDEPINNIQNATDTESDECNIVALYQTVFDREESTKRETILMNVAYIISCFILENYREYIDNKLSIYDKICSTIADIYFKEFCQIDLSKKDKEILGAIINATLYKINAPCAIYSTLDQVLTSIICEQNVAQNDADIERIKDSIERNSTEIINRMNYLALVFTNLFIDKTVISDYCNLDAARIICVSPYSFEYDQKLKYLTNMLISYHTKYNESICRKYDSFVDNSTVKE